MAEKNGTINESVIEKVYGTSAGIDFNSPPQQRIMQLVSDVQCFSRYKIDDVFTSTVVDSSLKNNKDANEEVKTLEENTDKVVEEIQESEIEEKKEEKPKEEQVSLNDFFDEFKI